MAADAAPRGPTLAALADDLAAGRTTSRRLTKACLAAIDAPGGQGGTAFVAVDRAGALAAADAIDADRAAGRPASRFAGIPISIKDLFDIAGQITRAGSVVLSGPAAATDAAAVARLRAAGFVPIGRTNMTEFAFSGLGLNPHYGTPLSPWHRGDAHIAGGSTSGGAVSVADGMAHATLGTDTGGSCRIPAAWCRLVGFKPTARRVSGSGAVPLSATLDSVGSIARSVACCAAIDATLSGDADALTAIDVAGLRFAAIETLVLEDIVPDVAAAYQTALERLVAAGAVVDHINLPAFARIAVINAKGGFAAAEAWDWHRDLIERDTDRYDPRVAVRVRRGALQTAEDRNALHVARAALIAEVEAALAGYDAMVMPTVPILPPRLSKLTDDAAFARFNLLALRNPTTINMIDGCAISLPIGGPDAPPVGLTLAAPGGADRRLLAIAQAVEPLIG